VIITLFLVCFSDLYCWWC